MGLAGKRSNFHQMSDIGTINNQDTHKKKFLLVVGPLRGGGG